MECLISYLLFTFVIVANAAVSDMSLLNGKIKSHDDINRETFKFIVSIRQNYMQVCGGFLTGLNAAVTTGDCISDIYYQKYRNFTVYTNGKNYSIKGLMSHHLYNIHEVKAKNKNPEYNFGLIQIETITGFSKEDFASLSPAVDTVGENLDILGYNTKTHPLDLNQEPYSGVKRIRVQVQSSRTCFSCIRSSRFKLNHHMCAYGTNDEQAAGSRDIGVPLIMKKKVVGVLVVFKDTRIRNCYIFIKADPIVGYYKWEPV